MKIQLNHSRKSRTTSLAAGRGSRHSGDWSLHVFDDFSVKSTSDVVRRIMPDVFRLAELAGPFFIRQLACGSAFARGDPFDPAEHWPAGNVDASGREG